MSFNNKEKETMFFNNREKETMFFNPKEKYKPNQIPKHI